MELGNKTERDRSHLHTIAWGKRRLQAISCILAGMVLPIGTVGAQQPSFAIDAATLAAQVPPRMEGEPLPLCTYSGKEKLCAVAHGLVTMIDTTALPKYLDPDRLKMLSKKIKAKPGNVEPLMQRAQIRIGAFEFAPALADLNQLIKVAPSSPSALVMRAQLYVLAGQYALAERDVEAIRYWDKVRKSTLLGYAKSTLLGYAEAIQADIHLRRGELPQVLAALEKANAQDHSPLADKVLAGYQSARTGFSPDQMTRIRVFLYEQAYRNHQDCNKPAWLNQAITSDIFATSALSYLAEMPEKCQANATSLDYANRAVALYEQKLAAGSFRPTWFADNIAEAYRIRADVEERLGQNVAALKDFNAAYVLVKAAVTANPAALDWRELMEKSIDRVSARLPASEVAALGIKTRSVAQRNVDSYNNRFASFERLIPEKLRELGACVDRWYAVTDRVKTYGEELHPELVAKQCEATNRELIGLLRDRVKGDEFSISQGTASAEQIAGLRQNMATHQIDLDRQLQKTFPWN